MEEVIMGLELLAFAIALALDRFPPAWVDAQQIVDAMEPRVQELAQSLVAGLLPKGKCEFVADFANVMPINIFLDLVDLPREERHVLLPLVEAFIKGDIER